MEAARWLPLEETSNSGMAAPGTGSALGQSDNRSKFKIKWDGEYRGGESSSRFSSRSSFVHRRGLRCHWIGTDFEELNLVQSSWEEEKPRVNPSFDWIS